MVDESGSVIPTERLTLRALDLTTIEMLLDDPLRVDHFDVPPGWPDDDDVDHLHRWQKLALDDDKSPNPWRARAVIDGGGTFVGHTGFHGAPVPIKVALDDPTFVGEVRPCSSGAVEVGYKLFTPYRSHGYAVEAVAGLIEWARTTGEVGAVLACVRPENTRSLKVLDRLGGFEQIGRSRDGMDDEWVFRRDL